VTIGQLLNFVPVFALVFFRLAGLMLFAPLFGSSRIPRRVKIMFALVMAMAVSTSLHIDASRLPQTTWGMAIGIGGEILFGLAMGTVVSFVFIAAQWAGEIIGQQMGLNISEVLDPQYGQAGSLIGDMYFMLTMVVFLSPVVRGHHALIRGVRASFDSLPLASVGVDQSIVDMIVGLFQASAALAIQLAAPMLMTMLIVDLALGCIGRAMPQMNVMAMGLTLRSIIGVVVLILGLTLTANVISNMHISWGSITFERWSAGSAATP
jgi:flagellar biosynthetic protein FliR